MTHSMMNTQTAILPLPRNRPRKVKKLDRLEKARLGGSTKFPRFASPPPRWGLQSSFHLTRSTKEEQNGLGSHAGLHHRHRRSRTAGEERISGCGEPYPESPRQGLTASFGS